MTTKEFFEQLEAKISGYNLLGHPFYRAWSGGELTRADLRDYAQDYYHHVEAFPTYLEELGMRLEASELRRAVLANLRDEQGDGDAFREPQRSHAELWLDFAEGMGASRDVSQHRPVKEIRELISFFHQVAREAAPEEALAAFYAYESQVPQVAKEKDRWLRDLYGADEKACGYFTLHTMADVHHRRVWEQQLTKRLEANPEIAEKALEAGEAAARTLWQALDGIEARRLARAADNRY